MREETDYAEALDAYKDNPLVILEPWGRSIDHLRLTIIGKPKISPITHELGHCWANAKTIRKPSQVERSPPIKQSINFFLFSEKMPPVRPNMKASIPTVPASRSSYLGI